MVSHSLMFSFSVELPVVDSHMERSGVFVVSLRGVGINATEIDATV